MSKVRRVRTGGKSALPSVSLPTTTNVPPRDFTKYCSIIYGEKGIGKSSLCSQFPNALVFMWEPRRRNLAIRQIPQQGEPFLNWERCKAYMKLLRTSSERPHIVMDTLDRVYDGCLFYVCKERGIEHPNDANDYGKTWNAIATELESEFGRMLDKGFHFTFTSHSRIREITPHSGNAFDMIVPSCSRAAFEYAKAVCDFAFYYGYHGQQRAFTVRGSEYIWSATGVDNTFMSPKGRPCAQIPAGSSAKEAYANIIKSFNNKLKPLSYADEVLEEADQ